MQLYSDGALALNGVAGRWDRVDANRVRIFMTRDGRDRIWEFSVAGRGVAPQDVPAGSGYDDGHSSRPEDLLSPEDLAKWEKDPNRPSIEALRQAMRVPDPDSAQSRFERRVRFAVANGKEVGTLSAGGEDIQFLRDNDQ